MANDYTMARYAGKMEICKSCTNSECRNCTRIFKTTEEKIEYNFDSMEQEIANFQYDTGDELWW